MRVLTLEKCQLPVDYLTGQALPRGKQESVCDFEEASVPFWLFFNGIDLAPPAQRPIVYVRDPISVSVADL